MAGNNIAMGAAYRDQLIKGTPTNDLALAGDIGEYLEANLLTASALSVTTATPLNITSLVLTPGDWDVDAIVDFVPAATTSVTQWNVSVSNTTATLQSQAPSTSAAINIGPFATTTINQAAQVPAAEVTISGATVRVSVSANTTIYLVAQAAFTVSTMTAYGSLRARRVR